MFSQSIQLNDRAFVCELGILRSNPVPVASRILQIILLPKCKSINFYHWRFLYIEITYPYIEIFSRLAWSFPGSHSRFYQKNKLNIICEGSITNMTFLKHYVSSKHFLKQCQIIHKMFMVPTFSGYIGSCGEVAKLVVMAE